MDGKDFHHTITRNQQMNEHSDIPESLRCSKCSKILVDAVVLKCCGIEICGDCLRVVRQKERCTNCGKEIDLTRDIMPNPKTRERVEEYWRKINADVAQVSNGKEGAEENGENPENGEIHQSNMMEEDENGVQKEDIVHIPIDEFFSVDIRDACNAGEVVDKSKKFVWSLYKTPCPKPFDGVLLFPKRDKTEEEIFDEWKTKILEMEKKMEEEQQ